MDVRLGWSGDIHGTWTKMDVEVDETDLQLLLLEHGVDPERSIAPLVKFKVMYSMAEIFVQLHKMSKFPTVFGGDEDKKELEALVSTQKKILASLT